MAASKGMPDNLVVACLCSQYFCTICLAVCSCVAYVQDRSSGGLTGSRLAGALGQIPVGDAFASHEQLLRDTDFPKRQPIIAMASWVDNLYAFSSSAHDAIFVLGNVNNISKTCGEWL